MKRFLKRVTAILLCLVLSCSLLPITGLAASSHPFRDVPSSHWANSAVAYVYDNGLMNGTRPNTFTPSGTLTRAMFVTILGRMDGVNTASYPGTSFSDVPTGQWYSPYVAWACRQGIVTGTGNGQFSPNTPVTREQMAAMIARYVDASGVSLPDADNPASSFKDAASVSSWARDGLELMRRTGLLSGYSDGTFGPKKTATRAEAATIFMRLCGRLDGEISNTPMVSKVNFDVKTKPGGTPENRQQYAVITGITSTGTTAWTIQTDVRQWNEDSTLGPVYVKIGIDHNIFYYYENCDGILVAVDVSSGNTLWKKAGFCMGYLTSYKFSDTGSVFAVITGYDVYTDIAVVGKNGNILYKKEFDPEEYGWSWRDVLNVDDSNGMITVSIRCADGSIATLRV